MDAVVDFKVITGCQLISKSATLCIASSCLYFPRPHYECRALLNACREADNREEESICVEVLEHALYRLPVDPERHAGSAQIQTAADHVVRVQQVLVNGSHSPWDSA